ncbi:hypothetical protein B0T24DRAFT_287372 [Lasiosphaeria ovina]|uniref:Uncharacterized protein n=1 Tax=Lasiosphaeria ovina TaxID=92902 RepID=A0AAE0N7Y0_9PEZI|nr:hypothetical protein B0T24DRAFT_287372 [Lasiosphaeria ovina]
MRPSRPPTWHSDCRFFLCIFFFLFFVFGSAHGPLWSRRYLSPAFVLDQTCVGVGSNLRETMSLGSLRLSTGFSMEELAPKPRATSSPSSNGSTGGAKERGFLTLELIAPLGENGTARIDGKPKHIVILGNGESRDSCRACTALINFRAHLAVP